MNIIKAKVIESQTARIKLTAFEYGGKAYLRMMVKPFGDTAASVITRQGGLPSVEAARATVETATNEDVSRYLERIAPELAFCEQLQAASRKIKTQPKTPALPEKHYWRR